MKTNKQKCKLMSQGIIKKITIRVCMSNGCYDGQVEGEGPLTEHRAASPQRALEKDLR